MRSERLDLSLFDNAESALRSEKGVLIQGLIESSNEFCLLVF